ncbi:MAG: hypothetical protein AB1425_00030 [Actinomycetota bacterium]
MSNARNLPLSPVRVGIIALTLATALIHLYLGLQGLPLFVLNGLGYITLLAALYLPVPRLARYRELVRWVLIGYAALTVFLWILVGARNFIGYADKAIEIALIALLLVDRRASRRA